MEIRELESRISLARRPNPHHLYSRKVYNDLGSSLHKYINAFSLKQSSCALNKARDRENELGEGLLLWSTNTPRWKKRDTGKLDQRKKLVNIFCWFLILIAQVLTSLVNWSAGDSRFWSAGDFLLTPVERPAVTRGHFSAGLQRYLWFFCCLHREYSFKECYFSPAIVSTYYLSQLKGLWKNLQIKFPTDPYLGHSFWCPRWSRINLGQCSHQCRRFGVGWESFF